MDNFLNRLHQGDQGTLGIITIPDVNWSCYDMELPWRENARGLSCIKTGDYFCELYSSKKFGKVYIVTNVEGRSGILTHWGNWAGDRLKGFITNSLGCILLGYRPVIMKNQLAVTNSRSTFDQFMRVMAGNNFNLRIR